MAGLWAETVDAALRPRRLGPVLALAVPLLAAQHAFSVDPWVADGAAIAMLVGFLLAGPWAWRRFVARGSGWERALYLVFGLVPFGVAAVATELGELAPSFLVHGVNGGVAAGLFLVGGWGLGRDIELELALTAERARAEALRRQAEAAELLALRSTLDPHFLFNTLNAIAEWCATDAGRAEAALLRLSALLRDILEGVRAPAWPLARELAVARAVLALHEDRDAGFEVDWRAEDLSVDVPPLLFLPLIENAAKYGPGRGFRDPIQVRVLATEGRLVVAVRNGGPLGPERADGHGLRMVRERLALAWGGAATVQLREAENGVVARVELPMGSPVLR